jgi:hypothetical protein
MAEVPCEWDNFLDKMQCGNPPREDMLRYMEAGKMRRLEQLRELAISEMADLTKLREQRKQLVRTRKFKAVEIGGRSQAPVVPDGWQASPVAKPKVEQEFERPEPPIEERSSGTRRPSKTRVTVPPLKTHAPAEDIRPALQRTDFREWAQRLEAGPKLGERPAQERPPKEAKRMPGAEDTRALMERTDFRHWFHGLEASTPDGSLEVRTAAACPKLDPPPSSLATSPQAPLLPKAPPMPTGGRSHGSHSCGALRSSLQGSNSLHGAGAAMISSSRPGAPGSGLEGVVEPTRKPRGMGRRASSEALMTLAASLVMGRSEKQEARSRALP